MQTLNRSITPIYTRLINRVDVYLGAKDAQWFTIHEPLITPKIHQALNGQLPVGLMSVDGKGFSRWIAIDVDDEADMEKLDSLARSLAPTNATLYELSRRGAHLFIFVEKAPWEDVRAHGLSLTATVGLEGVEVFPKHGGLNAIRMPGTIHPKTGERYPIIDPITGEMQDVLERLDKITPIVVPPLLITRPQPPAPHTGDFGQLIEALTSHTWLKVYAPGRAVALCLWHDDHSPSLLIKGGRFHCQRPDCVWGDLNDLNRWLTDGTRPPNH